VRAEISAYLSRVRMQAYEARDFSQIPQWVERNTRDPIHVDRNWTFLDHEYQIDIMADTAPEISAQKCSQVGASEFWVRMMLAMMGISKKITIIYILPTSGMATKFASGRIDPVIDDSPVLRAMIDKNLNNTRQKKLGRSLLYIAGTIGQNSAISVPAQALFRDEVDFCDQRTLTTFNSRLGHSAAGESLVRSFSTPTVFKYGINALFMAGSQASRLVKCQHCQTWVDIDYFRDVEIPGFDKAFREFEKEDLENSLIRVDDAFFRCNHCGEPMDEAWLAQPELRSWVHRYPDRKDHHSYQILPCDVPTINPLRRTIRQIKDYDTKKDWVNFKVGIPYEDEASSFLIDVIDEAAVSEPSLRIPDTTLEAITTRRCYMGVDVGKVCWITIGAPNDRGGFDTIYQERMRIDGENGAGKRAMQLFRVFSCTAGVVDAGPDLSLAAYLTEQGKGRIFACQYLTKRNSRSLDIIQSKDDETRIVQVLRSASFDELTRLFNRSYARLNRMTPEYELVKKHFQAMKRIETKDTATGEVVVQWVNVDEDHYAHSANYCMIAFLLAGIQPASDVIPYIPGLLSAKLKQVEDDSKRSWPSAFGG